MQITEIYQLYLNCGMSVSTDTRNIAPGQLFIALKGENFNGNLYAEEALQKGASFVVVDEGDWIDKRIILVENSLQCLQALSRYHRRQMSAKIIGIGGSNGKTSTKELMVSILSLTFKTHFTQGNFNNHIGLPLTLLQLRPQHQMAVIEMGANKAGDIKELCEIAEPGFGLITNIGKEHLEGFGDIEGVARAESELFDYLLKNNGHAFINMDDSWLLNMSKRLENKTAYGFNHSEISDIQTNPDIQFKFDKTHIKSGLMGTYNLQNILAALSVARYFGVSTAHIAEGIEKYQAKNNRSQWIMGSKGNRILLDAYNANPSSVKAALEFFNETRGFKVVVLGDMFELGTYEAEEHQAILDLCLSLKFDEIYLVGKAFAKCKNELDTRIHLYQDKLSCASDLKRKNFDEVTVLIKGSRGMKMETLQDLF